MTDQIDKKKSGALPLIFIGVLVCCLLWGSAFPCIKIGYKLWNIESGDVWSIILFAGTRFFLAGVLLRSNDVSKISVFGFMNPVIGVILSALLLGETGQLGINYIAALLLISAGIIIVNIKASK